MSARDHPRADRSPLGHDRDEASAAAVSLENPTREVLRLAASAERDDASAEAPAHQTRTEGDDRLPHALVLGDDVAHAPVERRGQTLQDRVQ